MLPQLTVTGISIGCIYALTGLGFNLIFNSTNIFNFGQGELLMLGAMFTLTLYATQGWPLWLALPLAVLATSLIAVLLQVLLIAPLRRRGSQVIMMIMGTMAFSIIAQNLSQAVWGVSTHPVPNFFTADTWKWGEVIIRSQDVVITGTTLLLLVLLWWFFQGTSLGLAMQACAINADAAQLCGVNIQRSILFSFALSGAVTAVAGAVAAPITYASATVGVSLGISGFAAAVVGGMGKPLGAVVGGLLLGLVQSLWAGYVSPPFAPAVSYLSMLLVLYLAPTGLFDASVRLARAMRKAVA